MLVALRGEAHKAGLSKGDYVLHGSAVTADVVLARDEIAQLAPDADTSHDGALDAAEIDKGGDVLARDVVDRIAIAGDGSRCPGRLVGARPVEGDGVLVEAEFACQTRPKKLDVKVALFDDLAFGHRHLASVVAGTTSVDDVLYKNHPSITVDVGAEVAGAPEKAERATGRDASLLWMGVEHILTGYDHLLFLFGLVLVGGRVRPLVGVVTAFTLAHSLTLAMAALGVFAPSPRIVEPAIALSIAYVGVENFFVKDASKRWRITFPFGLIHGFGFAAALRDLDLPKTNVPLALLLFNLGVEAGQLAVLAVVLPILFWLRKKPWFEPSGLRFFSAAIVAAGLVWFADRVRP